MRMVESAREVWQRPLEGYRTPAPGVIDRHREYLHAQKVDTMEATPIQVDPLRPKQAAPAGDLLAASHADYPSFRHLFADAATRRRVLRRFMTAVARDAAAHAHALVAYDKFPTRTHGTPW